MRHEYLSVYQLENNTINSNSITVGEIAVGGGGALSHEHNFATDGKTSGSHSVFAISGDVRIKLLPICTTDLVGNNADTKVSLGYNGALTGILAQTTASGLDSGEQWTSSAAATLLGTKATSTILDLIVSNKTAIKINVASHSMTTGKIKFYLWWEPISTGATVAVHS